MPPRLTSPLRRIARVATASGPPLFLTRAECHRLGWFHRVVRRLPPFDVEYDFHPFQISPLSLSPGLTPLPLPQVTGPSRFSPYFPHYRIRVRTCTLRSPSRIPPPVEDVAATTLLFGSCMYTRRRQTLLKSTTTTVSRTGDTPAVRPHPPPPKRLTPTFS